MENASKAILIAGAILIVIALIGIAMVYIYNTTDMQTVGKGGIASIKMKMHNRKFEKYENKDVEKETVDECIADIISNNSKNNSHEIKTIIDDAGKYVSSEYNPYAINITRGNNISRAREAAAGLLISEKMRSLEQAEDSFLISAALMYGEQLDTEQLMEVVNDEANEIIGNENNNSKYTIGCGYSESGIIEVVAIIKTTGEENLENATSRIRNADMEKE